MTDMTVGGVSGPETTGQDGPRSPPAPLAMGYALSVALVAAAGVAAFVVDHLVAAPNLSLVFVLPVIVAAVSFGWGPALAAALLSVGVFDFFFVEPRMSFQVANPTDLWALGLLLLVAAIVSTVASQSRRRAVEAGQAADQAQALHGLAHQIIAGGSSADLMQTAADALGRIFAAPAVILAERSGALTLAATSRGATLKAEDEEAAAWSLANDKATRAETYPFAHAAFDFWPIQARAGHRLVVGVKFGGGDGRPVAPDRHVELVAGYLTAAAMKPDAGA